MELISSFLFGIEENIQKNSYIWNTIAGLLNALQSVIILMVISRTNGDYDAGVFAIAFASANLFLNIGNYGMRSYQVTDIRKRFSFGTYLGSRFGTIFAMLVVSIAYICYGWLVKSYSADKILVILAICFLKMIDAIEDVFHGMFQQNDRLDVGAKSLTIRLVLTIITYGVLLFLTHNLLLSTVITTVFSFVIFLVLTASVYRRFHQKVQPFLFKEIKALLISCFGVFAAAFLSFYIMNAPKYAIDTYLSQEFQAYYGYIAMPVFVVGLLNNFLYQPKLTAFARDWEEKKKKKFIQRIGKQLLIILGLTAFSLFVGYFLGIPVLSWLYNTDLASYRDELMILLCGGGILAVVGFFTVIITIIRCQRDLLWCYLFGAGLAWFLSPWFVRINGITGASVVYTLLVSILLLLFSCVLIYRIKKG